MSAEWEEVGILLPCCPTSPTSPNRPKSPTSYSSYSTYLPYSTYSPQEPHQSQERHELRLKKQNVGADLCVCPCAWGGRLNRKSVFFVRDA
jgi:hypothetical protein